MGIVNLYSPTFEGKGFYVFLSFSHFQHIWHFMGVVAIAVALSPIRKFLWEESMGAISNNIDRLHARLLDTKPEVEKSQKLTDD